MNSLSSQAARNFFDLMSLSEQYDLDLVQLKSIFRELQRKNHPDQFSSSSESEKLSAVKMSSLLNDAYEVLSHPVKRAQYLLELHGVDIQKDRYIAPDILMEQLALREEFEEILELNEGTSKEDALEEMHNKLSSLFSECDQQFSLESQKDLAEQDVLQNLKQILSRMLFVKKLNLELDKALDSLD